MIHMQISNGSKDSDFRKIKEENKAAKITDKLTNYDSTSVKTVSTK